MTESINFAGSGLNGKNIQNLLNRHSMDRAHRITSSSSFGNGPLSDIIVLTPELEQIGVRRPG